MDTTQMNWKAAAGAEWFAAWLPKQPAPSAPAMPLEMPAPVAAADEQKVVSRLGWIDEVRDELKLVTTSLLDPSAEGVEASLPHLERAVALFGKQIELANLPARRKAALKPAISSLEEELRQASRLFDNAYALQSGWAAQLGLNLDGTPQKVLYDRAGALVDGPPAVTGGEPVWEG
jgi:hypothetical protein